jgi:hypothetical protein
MRKPKNQIKPAASKSTEPKRKTRATKRISSEKKHLQKGKRKRLPPVKFAKQGKELAKKDALSPTERKAFTKCEAIIDEGMRTIGEKMFDVGQALIEVREGKLYKADFKTFAEYCSAKLNISRSYANYLASAAAVRTNLATMVDDLPANERQVRPLLTLKTSEEKLQAWQAALDAAGDQPVTEAHVRHAVDQIREANKPPVTPPPKPGERPAWRVSLTERYNAAGFEETFEQPVKWAGSAVELADRTPRFVKFIDELTLGELAFVTALRKQGLDVIVVIDALINAPSGVIFGVGGKNIEDCFAPSFNLVAKDLNAYLALDGVIYKAGELNSAFMVTWSPAENHDLTAMGLVDQATPSPATTITGS